jgi:hypothetical protein
MWSPFFMSSLNHDATSGHYSFFRFFFGIFLVLSRLSGGLLISLRFAPYRSPLSLVVRFHQAIYTYDLLFAVLTYDPIVELILSANYSK